MKRKKPRSIAYVRISTDKQDMAGQKHQIQEYARRANMSVNQFMEIQISSRKSQKARRIEELMEMLNPGDTLIVSELSRLGRSVSQIVTLVDELIRRKIKFIAIKENMTLDGKGTKDLQTTIMTTMFSLFAEVERTLISERTRAGLKAARAKGKNLGRPKGSMGVSKLEGKKSAIRQDLKHQIPKSAIAKKYDVSRPTLYRFMAAQGLD